MMQPIVIAVVDDDESLLDALLSLLRSYGHEARGFRSAEELLAVLSDIAPTCIVTDVHLTGMSGIELKAQLVREGSDVPVVMITGRDDAGLEARAFAAGATYLVRKPFETEHLIECIERSCR